MERNNSKFIDAFKDIFAKWGVDIDNEPKSEILSHPVKDKIALENDERKTDKSELVANGKFDQFDLKNFSMKKLEHRNESLNSTVSQFQTIGIQAKSTFDSGIENEPQHTCKLFIGNLHKVTTEENLMYYFVQCGGIENTFILRFPNSRRSACIGYILFQRSFMVTKAFSSAPHEIEYRNLTLKRAKEDGSDPEEFCTLFIQGLPQFVTERDVAHYFGQWGIVKKISLKLCRNKAKIGCVTFKYSYMMMKALTHESHKIKGSTIKLNMSTKKWHELESAYSRRLIVENLRSDTTEKTLMDYFLKYGKIESCVILTDPLTEQSKCVGYVIFEQAKVLSAIKVPTYHEIDKHKVLVLADWKVSKEAESGRKLIIENINFETSENTLIHYFEQFGKVEICVIAREDISRTSRGFGYLIFETSSSIEGVIQSQPHFLENKELVLTFPKSDDLFFESAQIKKRPQDFQKDNYASSSSSQVDGKPYFQQKNKSTSSNSSQVSEKSSIHRTNKSTSSNSSQVSEKSSMHGTASISSSNAQKGKRIPNNEKKVSGKEMMNQWKKSQSFKSKEYSLNDFDGAGVNVFSK